VGRARCPTSRPWHSPGKGSSTLSRRSARAS
jgi:hypothetical protein